MTAGTHAEANGADRSKGGSIGEQLPRGLSWSDWIFRLLLSLVVIATGVWVASRLAWVHPLFELSVHTLWHVGVASFVGFAALCLWMRLQAKRWFQEQGRTPLKFGFLMSGYCVLNAIFLGELQPWQAIPLSSIPISAISGPAPSKLEGAKGGDGPPGVNGEVGVNGPHAAADAKAREGEGLLRVMSWNVWIGNQNDSEVLRTIRERDADVVVLIEVGPWHLDSLGEVLREEYPLSKWIPRSDARGIAMLSRVPGMEFRAVDLAAMEMPAIEGVVPAQGVHRDFRILGVHTSSPNLGGRTAQRDQQLDFIRRWVLESGEEALVVGDFNITPWSKPFRAMLKGDGLGRGRLRDTREGHGFFATWPSGLGWMGIPIDHGLVTDGLTVYRRVSGTPMRGSDHGWIEVTIGPILPPNP